MLPLSLFAYDGMGCAGMQEEFLTSMAHIKKKLRLDMDSAFVRQRFALAAAGENQLTKRNQRLA
jgi:hypothetical protein